MTTLTPTRRSSAEVLTRDPLGRKQCRNCWHWLPEAKFRRSSVNSDGLNGWCTPCTVHRTHHLTRVEVEALLTKQGGRCPICHDQFVDNEFAIDHDHRCCPGPYSCGRCVRGLLCHHCNSYILPVIERDDLVENAQSYLNGGE